MERLKELTLKHVIEYSSANFQNLPFCGFAGGQAIRYKEYIDEIRRLYSIFHYYRLNKEDKVVILGENSPNWGKTYLSVTSSGLTAVPVLPDFPPQDIHHIIRHSQSKLVFVSKQYVDKLEEFDLGDVKGIIMIDDFSLISPETQEDFVSTIPIDETPLAPVMEDDGAVIIYTSGTTGHSKGVVLSHKNIVSDMINSLKRFPLNSEDVFLSILPMAHTYECTAGFLIPFFFGIQVYYIKGVPSPRTLTQALQRARPTTFMAVPLIIQKIYQKKILPQFRKKKITNTLYNYKLSRKFLHKAAGRKLVESFGGKIRFIMFGGAALPEDVETFLREARIPYSVGYGLSETSPILAINPLSGVKPGAAGLPIPEVKMKIESPDNQGIGEIIVKGPNIMKGYYKNDKANKDIFTSDGWLRTGDLGYIDEEGFLFIKGRSKNVIIGPNGKNIYPENIEQLLSQSPFIQQAIVYLKNDQLVAKVYPDYDELDKEFESSRDDNSIIKRKIEEILESIKTETNANLPSFSQLTNIIEHQEPFSITPTKKVKRYLYINGKD